MGQNDGINNFGGQTLDPGVSTAVRVKEGSRVQVLADTRTDRQTELCSRWDSTNTRAQDKMV